VVERLPRKHKALGSVPSSEKKEPKKKKKRSGEEPLKRSPWVARESVCQMPELSGLSELVAMAVATKYLEPGTVIWYRHIKDSYLVIL